MGQLYSMENVYILGPKKNNFKSVHYRDRLHAIGDSYTRCLGFRV